MNPGGSERHAPRGAGAARDVLHPDAAVSEIATRQHGVVSSAQIAAAGLGPRAVAHRVATGRWRRLHRGVYLVGPLTSHWTAHMAALVACGKEAALGFLAAGEAWGLLSRDPADAIDVVLVSGHVRPRRGVRIHRPRDLRRRDVAMRAGMPLTAPARTLLDLATLLDATRLARAVEEAQVLRLTSRRDIEAQLRRGRRGSGALRAALARFDAPSLTRSEAEARLLALIRAARLPAPATNVRIGRHEVDFHWPRRRLVVEVDGYRFHSSRAAFERDRLRDAELQLAGQRVLRVTWRQIAHEPLALAARLATALVA